jgi:hypothetical protein
MIGQACLSVESHAHENDQQQMRAGNDGANSAARWAVIVIM